MAIKIIIEPIDDPSSSMTHELDQSLITVGRSKSCHIELDHPEISRRHFIVKYEDTGYVLFDQQSRHGTFVEGEKLLPEKAYLLGEEQVIHVPGFSIRLYCDGEKPRLERTTVVARKLLDDLLQGEIRPREVPSLRSTDEQFHFKFVEEKTTFVLGSLAHADFVLAKVGIAKKHVSFIRDIFGIRAIPTPGNEVLINNAMLTDEQLLMPGSLLTIGDISFIYVDGEVNEKPQIPLVDAREQVNAKHEEIEHRAKPKNTLHALDRMFVLGFVAVCIGAVIVVVHLA